MNPTHVGRYLNGTRRHLTIFNGFSACGRKCVDLEPIERAEVAFEDWCQMCFKRATEQVARDAQAAYRERNDPRTVLLCSVRALHIAVDALVEIAEGDEEDAAEIALSASANVRQIIKWGGDE
jgi:hypothetical protein